MSQPHPNASEPTPTNDNAPPSAPFTAADRNRLKLYGAAVEYARAVDGHGKLTIPDAAHDLAVAAGKVSGDLSSHPRFEGLVNMLRHAAKRLDGAETDEQAVDALTLVSLAAHELRAKLGLAEDPVVTTLRFRVTPAAAALLTAFAELEASASTAMAESVALAVVTAAMEHIAYSSEHAARFKTRLAFVTARADISPGTKQQLADNRTRLEAEQGIASEVA